METWFYGDTLPNEEDRDTVSTSVVVQNFYIIKKLEDIQVPENSQDIGNDRILINYVSIGKRWKQWEIIFDS